MVTVRGYEASDANNLWELKHAFETGLGNGTGDEEKAAVYEAKLDDDYRSGYLDWVDRCVAETSGSVQVAVDGGLVGYVFVLPSSLAYVWDAAVLNELYVVPDRRGTGVADELLEAALDIARGMDLPLDRLVLDVDRANDRARAFYERHGFSHWGEMLARDL